MKYLLDTHILVWWYLNSNQLKKSYLALIDECEKNSEPVAISIISLWEIAYLASKGKINFSYSIDRWFSELDKDTWLQILPLTGSIILESTRLGKNFHKDPADRLIVATARQEGLKLLTADKKIIDSGSVVVA